MNKIKAPWWFWLAATLFTLWNLFGLVDFYNSVTVNEDYLMELGDDLGPAFIKFLNDMPMWAKLAWGTAIISAIIASLSLLLRKSWAVPLFILSFIAMMISFAYQLFMADMPTMPGPLKFMPLVVALLGLFEIWFSRRMRARSILS